MYQDKLAQLKKQLAMLEEGSLPEFSKRTKKIEQQYKERLRQNEVSKQVDGANGSRVYGAADLRRIVPLRVAAALGGKTLRADRLLPVVPARRSNDSHERI